MENTAAACALKDGCNALKLPEAAALELLTFLACKQQHEQLELACAMSPSSTLERLWDWMSMSAQATEAVSELLGSPSQHMCHEDEGRSATDLLLQRLYAVNILSYMGYQPLLEVWQEPNAHAIMPSGLQAVAYSSSALTGEQHQQLAAALEAYLSAAPGAVHEVSVPFGQPWSISVALASSASRPVQALNIRAVDGLTVLEFKKELLRQSYFGSSTQELRVFNGGQELFDGMCVPHVSRLRVALPGQLFC